MSSAFDFDRPLLLDGGTGRELLKRGAHVIGGCCGVGPEHIARLRSILDDKPAW